MWKSIVKPLSSVALITVVCSSVASAQTIDLVELGSGFFPWDASGDGSVVVGENAFSGEYFEWTLATGTVDIGGVTAGGGVGGTPRISDDGVFVGGSDFNPGSGLHEMSRYNRGTNIWTPLGSLGSSCSTEASSGWGISGDGNHVVGSGWLGGCSMTHAAEWSSGAGVGDLGSSVMGESTRANGVNEDGSVVVGWQDGAGRQGAVWVNGVQTVFPGTSEAQAVSSDGTWVVGIGASGTGNEAYRWSQGTGVEPLGSLGLPGFPPPRGFATAISGDGTSILGFDRGFGPPTGGEGWIWFDGAGLMSLDDYFAALGIANPTNIRFSLPLGMSEDGLTFVGVGRSDTAFSTAWIVQITEAECFLVVGDEPGEGSFVGSQHHFQTQVGPELDASYAVLLTDIPEFVLPSLPSTGRTAGSGFIAQGVGNGPLSDDDVPEWMQDSSFAVQVVMWNPQVFPGLPEQYTAGLHVRVRPNGEVVVSPYGTSLGDLGITYEIDVNSEGQKVIRFPFTIPGL